MQKFYEAYQFYGYRETQTGGVLTTANQTIRGDTPLIVCYAEKRFFEWHEDDKSVNIRASSGSYGGAAKCLSVPENDRSVVPNGLQMGSATTS